MPEAAPACPSCGAAQPGSPPHRDDLPPTPSLFKEFIAFIIHEKKWWLAPLLLVLVVVAALLIFSASSPLAPFLYPLF